MPNRLSAGCKCCCVLNNDYLPWVYDTDADRVAAGWVQDPITGLWQHEKNLPKDMWQIIQPAFVPEGNDYGFELEAATSSVTEKIGLEIRGAVSDDLLLRISSHWMTATAYRPAMPVLRITTESDSKDYYSFVSRNSQNTSFTQSPFLNDTEYMTFDAASRHRLYRLAKRNDTIVLSFRITSALSNTGAFLQPCLIEATSGADYFTTAYPIISGFTWPATITSVRKTSGLNSFEIGLHSEWDESFVLFFARTTKAFGENRKLSLSSYLSRFTTTKIGISGDEPLDVGVSGTEANVSKPTQLLPNVKCANPGYLPSMPRHYSLPSWDASFAGWDDTGLHHIYRGREETSSRTIAANNATSCAQVERHYYQVSVVERSNAYLGWGGAVQMSSIEFGPLVDVSRYHSDSDIGQPLRQLNAFEVIDDGSGAPIADIDRSYSGPVAIRRAEIKWTIELALDGTTRLDDFVDIVAQVTLTGDGQTEAIDYAYRATTVISTGQRTISSSPLVLGFSGNAGYLRRNDPISLPLAKRGTYYKRRTQQINYRKRIPRWSGELPTVVLTSADIESTLTTLPPPNEFSVTSHDPVFWVYRWDWNWRNAVLSPAGGSGAYNIIAETSEWVYGVNVAAILEVTLSPSSTREQPAFVS